MRAAVYQWSIIYKSRWLGDNWGNLTVRTGLKMDRPVGNLDIDHCPWHALFLVCQFMKTCLKKEGVLVLKEVRCVNMPWNRIKRTFGKWESGGGWAPQRGGVESTVNVLAFQPHYRGWSEGKRGFFFLCMMGEMGWNDNPDIWINVIDS